MVTNLGRLVILLIMVAVVGISACCKDTSAVANPIADASTPKVLVVVSSKNTLQLRDGKTHPTGYFLNELIVPVKKLVDQGYEVVFANPGGNASTMDKTSDSADHFGKDEAVYASYRQFHDTLIGLKQPKKLSAVIEQGLDSYAAVFFPGGHAPMEDLVQDADVATVLKHFNQTGKPTAFICHGPIALISTVNDPQAFLQALESGEVEQASKLASGWLYAGYKMTIFSTAEELVAEETSLDGKVRFYPDAALTAAGGDVTVVEPWAPNVIQDRELITAQNPGSDGLLGEILVKAIEANKSN